MTPYEARRGWPPRSFWLGFRLLSVCPVVQSFAMEHNTEESQQETQLEQFLLHATTEAVRELLLHSDSSNIKLIVQSVVKRLMKEHKKSHVPVTIPQMTPAVVPESKVLNREHISSLSKAKMKLLRCDDETCEYEDLEADGGIKVKTITKKIVKLKWEELPKNILVIKKLNDPLATYQLQQQYSHRYSVSHNSANAMFEELVVWLYNDKKMNVIVEPSVLAQSVKFPFLQTWSPSETRELSEKIHFLICIGGDGTMLWAQGLFQCCPVPPVVSFAAGSLGFLTTFDFSNYRSTINSFTLNGGFLTLRHRLNCQVTAGQIVRAGRTVPEPVELTALNEVLIDRGPSPYLTRLECFCDGVYMTTVQADGLILATPTGSTAYSLAAGGSMVHPLVPCILFTPVCPHSLSFRPLIFPDSANIKIKVPSGSRSSAWLTCDGRNRTELFPNDYVKISEWPVPVLCKNDETSDWFHSVTEILHWNERKQQKPTL